MRTLPLLWAQTPLVVFLCIVSSFLTQRQKNFFLFFCFPSLEVWVGCFSPPITSQACLPVESSPATRGGNPEAGGDCGQERSFLQLVTSISAMQSLGTAGSKERSQALSSNALVIRQLHIYYHTWCPLGISRVGVLISFLLLWQNIWVGSLIKRFISEFHGLKAQSVWCSFWWGAVTRWGRRHPW